MIRTIPLPRHATLYVAQCRHTGATQQSSYAEGVQMIVDGLSPDGSSWSVKHRSSGAPYLYDARIAEELPYPISISHSGDYVALAVGQADEGSIGIDLQIDSDKLAKVASRYLGDSEWRYYEELQEQKASDAARQWLLVTWSLKEAAFKTFPPQVDRRLSTNYQIIPQDRTTGAGVLTPYRLIAEEPGGNERELEGYYLFDQERNYALAYVVSPHQSDIR